jgi:hypothetical protein
MIYAALAFLVALALFAIFPAIVARCSRFLVRIWLGRR